MDIRKLQRAIVDGLEDVKAQDIVVFNTEHLSPLFERVIIASGTSNRQTKALAASVRDAVRAEGFQVLRTEGQDNGEWIIVDCAAAVVHIMQPVIRTYYNLEDIWGEKPVAIKLKAGKVGLVKASEPDADEAAATKKPAKAAKPAAKKTAAAKTPAKADTTRKPAAGKVAVKKVAAKKVAAKKAVAKKAPTHVTKVVVNAPVRTAAKKVAAKKMVAKKAATRKVVGKKVAVKKVAAKKVARKTSSRG